MLHSLYRIADLTVVPSIYEPFGLVALEAMASGCPCLVADTGGLREVVPNDDVGLRFHSRDPDSLGQMAERLRTIDGLEDVESSLDQPQPVVGIRLDRDAASDLGIGLQQIGSALRPMLGGETVTEWTSPSGDTYDVVVRLPAEMRDDLRVLASLPIAPSSNSSAMIRLDQVATVTDTVAEPRAAALQREGGRRFQDEHVGPITSWEEFEAFQWPDPERDEVYRMFEWCEEHLPDDMCVLATAGFAHFNEHLSWLMGYETLCYALFDRRDLVRAISERLLAITEAAVRRVLQFGRVRLVFGTDDMGFRSATLISPDDLREFVLPNHRRIAALVHEAGHPYLLHCCGNLAQIMDDLIDDVGIDAKHSYENAILPAPEFQARYGDRIGVLGGVDVDILARASAEEVRAATRALIEACHPRGRYAIGSGNSIPSYVPVENYLTMLDEALR